MNLERRALIAFVLSRAVFAVFYWWYSPVLKRQQQEKRNPKGIGQAAMWPELYSASTSIMHAWAPL